METAEEALGPVQQEQGRLNVDRADPEQAQKKVDERAAAEKVLFEEAFDKPHDKAETALAGISAGDQPTSLLRTPTETQLSPRAGAATIPSTGTQESTLSAPSQRNLTKTQHHHDRVSRPVGIKRTWDKAK